MCHSGTIRIFSLFPWPQPTRFVSTIGPLFVGYFCPVLLLAPCPERTSHTHTDTDTDTVTHTDVDTQTQKQTQTQQQKQT